MIKCATTLSDLAIAEMIVNLRIQQVELVFLHRF